MTQKKAIYYSTKMKKYYFNNTTVFGTYKAETVYNGDALKGGTIKTDKNGKKYILGYVEQVKSQKGYTYYKCTGFVPNEKTGEVADGEATQESAF